MYSIKNLTASPFTIYTRSGSVILPPNDTIKAELDDQYLEVIRHTRFIEVKKLDGRSTRGEK